VSDAGRLKRQRKCDGKRRHDAEAEARREAARLRASTDAWLRAYPCGFCGGWHVGRARRAVR
jgi:hypothetical protein